MTTKKVERRIKIKYRERVRYSRASSYERVPQQ